jgi:two-component system, LuxR family, response regulator FixJ
MDELDLDGKIIAIVDDYEIVLKGMRGLLEAYGASVLTYNNGDHLLWDLPFVHCVVVDYYMPDINGLDLVFELRKRAYRAPVIILTGMSNEISEERVAQAGITEVVEKTSGNDALLRAIQAATRASPE